MDRLQKLIATAGYGSRRWAERLIVQGRIEVNNKTAGIGDKAEITDIVKIDGRKIDLARYKEEETKVIILNKQAGFMAYSRSISELGCISLLAKSPLLVNSNKPDVFKSSRPTIIQRDS
jgi:16S rRNA U516 pseudouridylate synthase RsuA-like enzyme